MFAGNRKNILTAKNQFSVKNLHICSATRESRIKSSVDITVKNATKSSDILSPFNYWNCKLNFDLKYLKLIWAIWKKALTRIIRDRISTISMSIMFETKSIFFSSIHFLKPWCEIYLRNRNSKNIKITCLAIQNLIKNILRKGIYCYITINVKF